MHMAVFKQIPSRCVSLAPNFRVRKRALTSSLYVVFALLHSKVILKWIA